MLLKARPHPLWCAQVYYIDRTFAMGHVVIRRKRTVIGDESQVVVLFRCIQRMNPDFPFNTCYTGGQSVTWETERDTKKQQTEVF